jgi:hypothetical protein
LNQNFIDAVGIDPKGYQLKKKVRFTFTLLSYKTTVTLILVEVNGFEPMASCVQGRRSPS